MSRSISHVLSAIAVLALTGCATGYERAERPFTGAFGGSGGYWDKKGPGRLIKVGFHGNRFIDTDKVGVYLLRRCAEVSKREGSEYFILYQTLPDAVGDRRSSGRSVDTVGGSADSYAYILLTNKPGVGVLSSAEVIKRLQGEVNSGRAS
ncbi:CC0125/CC1285 family lipoprotein [Nevskia ramosa]|uniref:CC0125/CC1285 family lipoprotein n=1 Tax=Nevskia ramosa TaxID=64002 RepID=UPI003D137CF7